LGAFFHREIGAALELLANMGFAAGIALGVVAAAYLGLRAWRRWVFLRSVAVSRITVEELLGLIDSGRAPLIIDVRSALGREIDLRRIPGALAIELADVPRECQDLARNRPIVFYCNCPNEVTAAQAARLLAAQGFTDVKPLAGGLEAWVAAGHRVDEHRLAAAGA
jgi:rhodanese-related sulfurtransferase